MTEENKPDSQAYANPAAGGNEPHGNKNNASVESSNYQPTGLGRWLLSTTLTAGSKQ